MTTVSAADLAQMQQEALALMPDQCSIVRSIFIPDGQGGQTKTGEQTLTPVPCRLAFYTSRVGETVLGGRMGIARAWYITMPAGTVVEQTDRILIGSRSFEVVAPLSPHTFSSGMRVWASEIL